MAKKAAKMKGKTKSKLPAGAKPKAKKAKFEKKKNEREAKPKAKPAKQKTKNSKPLAKIEKKKSVQSKLAKQKTKIQKLAKAAAKVEKKRLAAKPGKKKKIAKPQGKAKTKSVGMEKGYVSVSHAMPRAGESVPKEAATGPEKKAVKKPGKPGPDMAGGLREIRLTEECGGIKVGLYSWFGLLREDTIEKSRVGEEIKLILSSAVRTMKPGDEIFISGLGQEELKAIIGARIQLSTDSELFVEEYEEGGKTGLRIFAGPTDDEIGRGA
ncbi:MAG: hypothetical protein NT157_03355 [Candidatus Micrarchaeota archaeon]|nr:hypothetical protein [Candidatus Micrarchaeota archaeon]